MTPVCHRATVCKLNLNWNDKYLFWRVINIWRTLSSGAMRWKKITYLVIFLVNKTRNSLINSDYQRAAEWCPPQTLLRESVRGGLFTMINIIYPNINFYFVCSVYLKWILPCSPQIKSKPNLFIHSFAYWVNTNVLVYYKLAEHGDSWEPFRDQRAFERLGLYWTCGSKSSHPAS